MRGILIGPAVFDVERSALTTAPPERRFNNGRNEERCLEVRWSEFEYNKRIFNPQDDIRGDGDTDASYPFSDTHFYNKLDLERPTTVTPPPNDLSKSLKFTFVVVCICVTEAFVVTVMILNVMPQDMPASRLTQDT